MNIAKKDVVEESGALQLCAGQKSGSEVSIFKEDETDGVLVIDTSNAFNALKRKTALHNIRQQCPITATYATNTYTLKARLFITGGQENLAAEGTTQGDCQVIW